MMDILGSPLVLTKLRAPALRPRIVPRVHLLERLTSEIDASLVLVCAPAGYGKTTLLAEWSRALSQASSTVAWLSLDPGDNDPLLFGSYLVASLAQTLGPESGLNQIAQQLRSMLEIDLQKLLPAVINAVAACGRACVLMLDDYHLISDAAIHQAMAYLLEHLPDNLRVAIGSRSNPPLPLARLRAQGRLVEIRAGALRFNEDEAAHFLNEIMRLDLTAEGVAALEERTEGWVAGLQLAALSLSGRPDRESIIASFSGRHRYLVDYLLEEVVDRQPEAVQEFLLFTSILERMCASLCDAMLGTANSEAILRQLEQANIFVVALDDQGAWYRYHALFRDFLKTWLEKTQPERLSALHRAASDWLAANGSLREAAAHAFQTRDWDCAAAFVEQHAFTLIVHSEIATIWEWCSAFPEDVMRRHPMLYIHQCWPMVLSFRKQYRDRIEQRLQQAGQAAAGLEDRQLANGILEASGVIRGLLAMTPDPAAEPRQELDRAQQALEEFPEGDANQFSPLLLTGYAFMALKDAPSATNALEKAREIALREGLYFGVVESTVHLAQLAISQGRLEQAAQLCRQGRADLSKLLVHPEEELRAIGCLDVVLGTVLMEQNQLGEAEQLLLHGFELMGGGMNPYYLMLALVGLYRLREIQGRSQEALEFLARLEEAWPDISFCTQGLRIVHGLHLEPDDAQLMPEAARWSEGLTEIFGLADFLPGMGPFGAAEVYYQASLAWVRVQIMLGRINAVHSYLQRQIDGSTAHGLNGRAIELSILEALASKAEGEDRHALAALERALAAGEPEGYLQIFIQGVLLDRLLREASGQGIASDYIERIRSVVQPMERTVNARKGPAPGHEITSITFPSSQTECVELPSERELEVLRLIARGASNQAISEQLVITVGTVKSHINHILGKLGARNRTEAVAKARGLGWLDDSLA